MDIPMVSMVMARSDTLNKVGFAVLDKSLETTEQMGEGMIKMMENSVNPAVGSNFDVSV